MKVIVGLGNPGFKYRNTRHNIGFMVLDSFAGKHRIRIRHRAYDGVYGIGKVKDEEVMLFKPLTYMNLSGMAVLALLKDKGIDIKELLVISDDFNLMTGSLRIRPGGSSGGHNGLKSLIENIGVDFARLRIGVGKEALPEDKATYVLAPFSRQEKGVLAGVIERSEGCVDLWVEKGSEMAMRQYNC
ncbi:MAG: aminoacyl-tRNA hydrolase [Candidatus Omnitrophica bacterium]|nr:aminoacyl-tRNA hydrolase [Candidatus Omnitrophota bacterium]